MGINYFMDKLGMVLGPESAFSGKSKCIYYLTIICSRTKISSYKESD